DDDEPAVITDADAAEDPTGKITPLRPRSAPAEPQDPHDPATEELPAYVEDHFSEDSPTDSFAPVNQAHPTTGSLPIQADPASESRAKQKNFFPASAASAASARSAQSASSSSAASADSAAS